MKRDWRSCFLGSAVVRICEALSRLFCWTYRKTSVSYTLCPMRRTYPVNFISRCGFRCRKTCLRGCIMLNCLVCGHSTGRVVIKFFRIGGGSMKCRFWCLCRRTSCFRTTVWLPCGGPLMIKSYSGGGFDGTCVHGGSDVRC